MYHCSLRPAFGHHGLMTPVLDLQLDRTTKTPLTDQIRNGITTAISAGVLAPGARLPSWRDLAAQLGVSRGTVRAAYERLLDAQLIVSSRIVITAGFRGALGLALRVLALEGKSAWIEDPCFPLSRRALQIAQMSTVPVPVDAEGMDVAYGIEHASDAALAVVTAGQQAPLGTTLSLARRLRLLEWAAQAGAWIIEDDYLGELQLRGRAAPALASLDRAGRVIHIGSFSKTINPSLRLGFIVVPPALAQQFVEAATCVAPAPGPAVQLATAEFMRDGHYMRHLRRMKRVYATRRDALSACLESHGLSARLAGLAMLLQPSSRCVLRAFTSVDRQARLSSTARAR